jgi:hypothetical protein
VKATYGNIEVKGGVAEKDGRVLIACPSCGNVYSLPNPPFTFDRERISIGPASIRLVNCGWHGYLTDGAWITSPDSTCGGKPKPSEEERKKMAIELKKGDKVKALRSSNKAIELIGTVSGIDALTGKSITIEVETAGGAPVSEGHQETVHIDDVTVLEAKPKAKGAKE